jgi:hypothetical protein
MAVCNACPTELTYSAALAVVDANASIYDANQINRVRGNILLAQQCLQAVMANNECAGPSTNESSQLVCPRRDIVVTTSWYATGNSGLGMMLDTSKLDEQYIEQRTESNGNGTITGQGQYL